MSRAYTIHKKGNRDTNETNLLKVAQAYGYLDFDTICKDHIPIASYRILVEQMCLFLDGKSEELTELIEQEMKSASDNLEFEKAAELRDRLTDIETIMSRQKIVDTGGISRDVLGIARTEEAALELKGAETWLTTTSSRSPQGS